MTGQDTPGFSSQGVESAKCPDDGCTICLSCKAHDLTWRGSAGLCDKQQLTVQYDQSLICGFFRHLHELRRLHTESGNACLDISSCLDKDLQAILQAIAMHASTGYTGDVVTE